MSHRPEHPATLRLTLARLQPGRKRAYKVRASLSYLPLAQELSSIPAEPMSFACRAEADREDAPGFAPTRLRYHRQGQAQ